MRRVLLLLAGIGIACSTPSVTLDRYRGLYTTHFDGIPDRALVCAVLTNRGEEPVDWVRLRLVSSSTLGARPGRRASRRVSRWASNWVWSGRLEPGASVAIRLPDPPVAEHIALGLRGSGRGRTPRGRTSEAAPGCSIDVLESAARASLASRTAPGIELHAALPRGVAPEPPALRATSADDLLANRPTR